MANTKFVHPIKAWLYGEGHAGLEAYGRSRLLHTLGEFMDTEIVPYPVPCSMVVI